LCLEENSCIVNEALIDQATRKDEQQMDYSEFKRKIQATTPQRTVLQNPGGGTSTILSYSSDAVRYQRGNSTIYVSFRDLFDAYMHYKGGEVSSSDLKRANPAVFDSQARPAGHSCNCTFMFMLLKRIGVVNQIHGRGVAGDPFYVVLS
jgi:hypothetical protein